MTAALFTVRECRRLADELRARAELGDLEQRETRLTLADEYERLATALEAERQEPPPIQ